MKLIQNMKIRRKLQVTGVLYLLLISIVIYFFISSNELIKRSSEQGQMLNALSSDIRRAELAVTDYVHQRISKDTLDKMLQQLESRLPDDSLKKNVSQVKGKTATFKEVRSRNQAIEGEITTLTEASLAASNDVIKKISDRLVGFDTRMGVSDMERAVIVGASMNTNANFRIRLLFGRLKQDIAVKDELIKFLDTLVTNVTKDIELLKGTSNEAAARQAKANNLQIKALVLEFIDNEHTLNALEHEINAGITAIAEGVEKVVDQSNENLFSTIKGYFSKIIGVILIASVLGILVNFFIAKNVSDSIQRLNEMVKDLADGEGELNKRIQVSSEDETGELARWINLFVEKLQMMLKEISADADSLKSASSDLTDISGQMSHGAQNASEKSNSVASAAEDMSSNMNSVAAASEEASANVSLVASSTEEMAVTVKEIAKSSEKARIITNDAVAKASGATSNINRLGDAADQISRFTEVITEISEQTNLLALNATIEAARAGEAGKGFAVVANEIKELARQTAQATSEIKSKIEGIQNSSTQTIDEITIISQVINEVDEIVSTIAAAVEEQAVSTEEIAGNVSQASLGINDVNENVAHSSSSSAKISEEIADVNQAARMLVGSSDKVSESAGALSSLAEKLHQNIGRFKL